MGYGSVTATFFRLLNAVVACLLVLGGVILFVHIGSWNSGILGVFLCIFGIFTLMLEFFIPEIVVYNFGFMFSMLGRGIFYVVGGVLCLSWRWYNIVVGTVIMAVGVLFVFLHFRGTTPSPSMSAGAGHDYGTAPSTYDPHYDDPSSSRADLTGAGISSPQPNMSQTYQNPDPVTYDPARP
ncbi:Late Golgi vesicles protein [Dissophora globulifera]|uniref:Late Golgi vesicles protein n=1 Tax=Dissophora globulifera TaxID=979702 RepID=A0A9P6R6E6_9FUNG|nr:Late Golgi vesicles protein [Dissophora globulifera]